MRHLVVLAALLWTSVAAAAGADPAATAAEARTLQANGQTAKAAERYGDAVKAELAAVSPRLDSVAAWAVKAARVCQQSSDLNAAYQWFDQARALYERLGNRAGQADALNDMGAILYSAGQYDDALKFFSRSLEINTALGAAAHALQQLNNIGLIHYERGDYDKAIEAFGKASRLIETAHLEDQRVMVAGNLGLVYYARADYDAALKQFQLSRDAATRLGKTRDRALSLGNIGMVHMARAEYDSALTTYADALAMFTKLADRDGVIRTLTNVGMVYYVRGDYDKALSNYTNALATARLMGARDVEASVMHSIGLTHYARGRYREALESYQGALKLVMATGRKGLLPSLRTAVGTVYHAWGSYDQALDMYKQALACADSLGMRDQAAYCQRLIGNILQLRGNYADALAMYRRAAASAKDLGRSGDIPGLLDNIGTAFFQWGQPDSALACYREALSQATTLTMPAQVAREYVHIGGVCQVAGDQDSARAYYAKALTRLTALGSKADAATCLNNIGASYHTQGDYADAADYYRKSLLVKEELRATADGESRRDYVAAEIATYQRLIAAYVSAGQPDSAFRAAERSSARYLAEQLGAPDSATASIDIATVRSALPATTALVRFANVGWPVAARFTLHGDSLHARPLAESLLTVADVPRLAATAGSGGAPTRGFVLEQDAGATAAPGARARDSGGRLRQLVTEYRALLVKPHRSDGEQHDLRAIAADLYRFLFDGAEGDLAGATELLVIPDGVLSLLPFEALIMPDGRYLCERFTIRYGQSLAVLGAIDKRDYPSDRKPLLALGGAVYAGTGAARHDSVLVPDDPAALGREIRGAVHDGRSLAPYYERFGCGVWPPLPGTLDEVKGLARIAGGATLVTGSAASERFLRDASANGTLAQYRIVHIATHAVTIPEAPELSAIVLSPGTDTADDGYLTMHKVATLHLRADLVTLSACETALGTMYAGEGVVGLAQAFLVAGAKGLVVSLWQVADRSTAKLMRAMYRAALRDGMSFPSALTLVKRRFIAGDFGREYRDPYYWAPFVCFGGLTR